MKILSLPILRAHIHRLGFAFSAVALAFAASACASGQAYAGNVMPEREAQVHHVCTDVMGLNASEYAYQLCTMSLKQTLASVDEAQRIDRDRAACAARGLQPGTRDFALCVVGNGHTSVQN